MLSIDECWAVLESCLGDRASELPAGASAEQIEEAEKTMGVRLPEDVHQSLQRHDGSGSFFIFPFKIGGGGQSFLPLKQIVSLHKGLIEIGEDFEGTGMFGEQTGPVKERHWSPAWVPFTDNQCGDSIFIDLDPADGGSVGQVVDWWHECGESTWLASGLREWLNEVVENIRQGVYQFGDEM